MSSTAIHTQIAHPAQPRPLSRLQRSILACVSAGLFLAAAPAQGERRPGGAVKDGAPQGVDVIRTMAMYLARGTGQWIAPYSSDGDGPDAVGLWFELSAQNFVLELTVVFHYGDKVQPYSKSYWFWHPGRREVQYHEVSPGGSIRTGTTHFSDEKTFVTLSESIAADGTKKPNRGENVMLSDDEHVTTAFVKDAAGEWVASNEYTWKRVPESERKSL